MFGLKSLKLSLLLTWMLSSTGEIQQISAMTVTVGDDVTLICEDYKEFNDECYSTTWLYSDSLKLVPLFEHGKIHSEAGSKSDRLSVTAECFLVIKKVRVEDDGYYICRQFDSSGHQVTDSMVQLSVIKKSSESERTSSTISPLTMATTSTAAPHASASLLLSLIGAAVGLVALLITTVMIIRWRKTKGSKTQMDDTTTDPADVVYTSIGYLNISNAGAPVDYDPDEHRVTYSTVKAPAAASTDPTNLYATIQKYR